MNIQVVGSGCPTCAKLNEITKKAVAEMGLQSEVEYITGSEGIQKIIELGAMTSPLLVVNSEIAMTGFTPDVNRIKEKIQAHITEK
jgi:small redox-active disulfide protein 2